ncbi:DUF4249 domain-containing protein [uncultured Roseivirga sp.]|uniref:DUF4249 domain-containing protein n=1 Tax=uncultured Roseivirga sp. TaxID=543088 RepID=UPI0030D78BBD|tara:strand:+ start:140852 stop:142081 length:1230 start_codon:yes stop_codon:yes gene_type:complete
MRKTKIIEGRAALLLWCLVTCSGCAVELDKGFLSYEKLVVVDGILTDENKTQEIKLSYSTPINEPDIKAPISGAQVWIEVDNGEIIDFEEDREGVYLSLEPYQAIAGASYKLIFVLDAGNGSRYESSYELMSKPTSIEEIGQRYANLPSSTLGGNISGLWIFIDTGELSSDPSFFRYEWNETHQIVAPYPTKYYWKRGAKSNDRVPVPDTCYRENFSNSLILSNTSGISGNRAFDVPLRFLPVDNLDLTNRYSIEVTQYSINDKSYAYYNKLREFNESSGSLFDKQQGIVLGNLSSVSDENEIVLGYFEVSSVTRFRKFYNIDEFGVEVTSQISGFSQQCKASDFISTTLDSLSFYNPDDPIEKRRNAPYRIYLWEPSPSPYGTSYLRLAACVSCTRYGKLEKPTYWID